VEVPVEQNIMAAANPLRESLGSVAIETGSQEIGDRDGWRVGPVGGETERRGVDVVGLVVIIGFRRNVASDE